MEVKFDFATLIIFKIIGKFIGKHSWRNSFIDKSSQSRGSVKTSVLRNFANFTGKQLCRSLFLRPATLLKRCSNFLWNLPIFYKHLFWRTSVNNCFCMNNVAWCSCSDQNWKSSWKYSWWSFLWVSLQGTVVVKILEKWLKAKFV